MGEIKIWALHTTCTCTTLVFGAVYYKKKERIYCNKENPTDTNSLSYMCTKLTVSRDEKYKLWLSIVVLLLSNAGEHFFYHF